MEDMPTVPVVAALAEPNHSLYDVETLVDGRTRFFRSVEGKTLAETNLYEHGAKSGWGDGTSECRGNCLPNGQQKKIEAIRFSLVGEEFQEGDEIQFDYVCPQVPVFSWKGKPGPLLHLRMPKNVKRPDPNRFAAGRFDPSDIPPVGAVVGLLKPRITEEAPEKGETPYEWLLRPLELFEVWIHASPRLVGKKLKVELVGMIARGIDHLNPDGSVSLISGGTLPVSKDKL